MAKFYGAIGYMESVETSPGVWKNQIIEREYAGDLVKSLQRFDSSDKLNDDISITKDISVVADVYAYENLSNIRYVTYAGSKWKVTSVDIQYPRLILSVGGLYNG